MSDLGPLDEYFVRLIDNPAAGIVGLLVAIAVGAAHALAPGHGKAMGAAYLIGEHGTPRHALWLGLTVAGMHSLSVVILALGLQLLVSGSTQGPPLPTVANDVTPVLRLAAGVVVMTVGVLLLVRAARHRHTHDLRDGSPLSRRGLFALGVSGGLLPSPSAFLVLATAVFTGRTAFGLLLVAAFSVGLAATVTAVGLAAVRGRDLLASRGGHRWAHRIERGGPFVAAVVVLAVGVILTVNALRTL